MTALALTVALLAPTPAPEQRCIECWRTTVATYFPAAHVNDALKVLGYESSGSPNAVNPTSGTTGLFQVDPENLYRTPHQALADIRRTWPETATSLAAATEWLKNPARNTYAAAMIWRHDRQRGGSGWAEWACKPWGCQP